MISQMTPAGARSARRARRDGRADGGGAVDRRDAAADAVAGVDRDRERGTEWRPVLAHHHRQAELLALVLGERQADEPPAVRGHEVDVLRRDTLGGDAQVALVLPVLVVHQDDHAAGADVLQRLLDGNDSGSVTPLRHRSDDNRRVQWRPACRPGRSAAPFPVLSARFGA